MAKKSARAFGLEHSQKKGLAGRLRGQAFQKTWVFPTQMLIAVVMPTRGPNNRSKHTSTTQPPQKLLQNYFVFLPTSLTGALLL